MVIRDRKTQGSSLLQGDRGPWLLDDPTRTVADRSPVLLAQRTQETAQHQGARPFPPCMRATMRSASTRVLRTTARLTSWLVTQNLSSESSRGSFM